MSALSTTGISTNDINILPKESPWQSWGESRQESSLHFGKVKNPATGEWEIKSGPSKTNVINFEGYTVNLDSIGAIELLLHRIYSNIYNVQYRFNILLIIAILLVIGLFIFVFIENAKIKTELENTNKEIEKIKIELDKKTNII